MSDNRSPTIAPALEKGLEIVELLARSAKPLLLTEIARDSNRKVSEIQRMVQTLLARGFLYRESQGGYFLSSKLFRLAHQYSPFRHLCEISRPYMEDYSRITGESVHLTVLYENQGLIIEESQGTALVRITVGVGTKLDIASSVSGLILLSDKSSRTIEALLPNLPANKRMSIDQYAQDIARDGFLYRESSAYDGLHDLGVPVSLSDDTIIAALTTTWAKSISEPLSENDLLDPLNKCAIDIGTRLGSR